LGNVHQFVRSFLTILYASDPHVKLCIPIHYRFEQLDVGWMFSFCNGSVEKDANSQLLRASESVTSVTEIWRVTNWSNNNNNNNNMGTIDAGRSDCGVLFHTET
jgi:hypothetical protein